jgi:hypothetical protein
MTSGPRVGIAAAADDDDAKLDVMLRRLRA